MITQQNFYPRDNAFGTMFDAIADLPEIAGSATLIALMKRAVFELMWIRSILADDSSGATDLELFNRGETGPGPRAAWITQDQPPGS